MSCDGGEWEKCVADELGVDLETEFYKTMAELEERIEYQKSDTPLPHEISKVLSTST